VLLNLLLSVKQVVGGAGLTKMGRAQPESGSTASLRLSLGLGGRETEENRDW
jgi:hypothetical protein